MVVVLSRSESNTIADVCLTPVQHFFFRGQHLAIPEHPASTAVGVLAWLPRFCLQPVRHVPVCDEVKISLRTFTPMPALLVPCLTTSLSLSACCSLCRGSPLLASGIYSFKQGNKQMSQKLMRGRVAAQGFTILVMTAGLYMAGPPQVGGTSGRSS